MSGKKKKIFNKTELRKYISDKADLSKNTSIICDGKSGKSCVNNINISKKNFRIYLDNKLLLNDNFKGFSKKRALFVFNNAI